MTEAATSTSAQETILVVEDEVFARMVISEYLRQCGYKVIEAANADEALTILKHTEINIDVVFTVVQLPGSIDGFGLATWIRKNRPNLDVVLTSTVSRAANAAAELCEEGPLPRPYEPQAVVDRIRRLRADRSSRGAAGHERHAPV
jgi:CheY-like chemotaxis protein